MRRLTAGLVPVVALLAGLCAPPAPAATGPGTVPVGYCYGRPTANGVPDVTCLRIAQFEGDVCRAIEGYALAWALPPDYFARLIWQESRFDPFAVSPAGAQGIAQFMPGTGRLRGLANAFNPAEALARSAEYLRFLADKYGNLGLAAAAYNAGEGRIGGVVGGAGYIPLETENYVQIVTGHTVWEWLDAPPADVDYRLAQDKPFAQACIDLAKTRTMPTFEFEPGPWKPWGVQVAAFFSPQNTQRAFKRIQARFSGLIGDETPMILAERNPAFGRRIRYHARIGRDTREAAEQLCAQIQKAGGACIVMKT